MNNKKGFVVSFAIVLFLIAILVAGISYFGRKQVQAPEMWATYVNSAYGFSFQYPSGWKAVESSDGLSVSITSGIKGEGTRGPVDALKVSFIVRKNSDFKPIGTKMGDIRYDETFGALVDALEQPVRCLPSENLMGINETLPAVVYGANNMTDPAYVWSSILTDEDYMVLVHETNAYVSDRRDAAAISAGKIKIYSTFALATTVKVRSPKCTAFLPKASDLTDAGTAVLKALESNDYKKLETLTSGNGLSLNLYPNLDLTKSTVSKNAVSDIAIDSTQYVWGYTDGKGDKIVMTTAQFIRRYFNTVSYVDAEQIAVGKTLGGGNSVNTILADAGDRAVIAYYVSGLGFEEMDWTTLYLVFENENGSYKLRGIAKDNWTI